jgi:hypothetical protein
MENEFIFPDGGKRWFELSIQPVPEGLFILSIDVTERKRIEKISKLRNKMRKTVDLSSGLDLILHMALNDLGMDVAAAFAIDRKEKAVKLQGFKSNKDFEINDYYPLGKRFVELKTLKVKKPVSEIIEETDSSILNTVSIHCAPIMFGKAVYGVLTFGSWKKIVLKESDLAILNLYSELVSTLIEAHSLNITPVKEVALIAKKRFPLETGCSYLVKNDVEKAFEIFMDQVLSGSEGLCITREFPLKIRRKYKLEKTPIIWLTEEKAGDERTIFALQDLSILMNQFLESAKHGVVLLDGFEYLIVNHGFEPFIRFLQLSRNRFESKDAVLIAPMMEKAFDVKEEKLIEREMNPLKAE